jgi:hypothetical protein
LMADDRTNGWGWLRDLASLSVTWLHRRRRRVPERELSRSRAATELIARTMGSPWATSVRVRAFGPPRASRSNIERYPLSFRDNPPDCFNFSGVIEEGVASATHHLRATRGGAQCGTLGPWKFARHRHDPGRSKGVAQPVAENIGDAGRLDARWAIVFRGDRDRAASQAGPHRPCRGFVAGPRDIPLRFPTRFAVSCSAWWHPFSRKVALNGTDLLDVKCPRRSCVITFRGSTAGWNQLPREAAGRGCPPPRDPDPRVDSIARDP